MNKILVVSYSQSGQLHEIVKRFLQSFDPSNIEYLTIQPQNSFPFPWTSDIFFDTMPETVLEEPIPLHDMRIADSQYSLVILAYQPWFLSPSLPISSLLQHEKFRDIVRGVPVVTLIAGRNMWLNAQESVKKHIRSAGGKLVGNIPFMDRTSNLISAVTILHWMLTGRKDRKWGIFPLPGVSEKDIESAAGFGKMVSESFNQNNFDGLQKKILSSGLIEIPTDILFIEQRAKKIFYLWANLIKKKGTTPQKRKNFVILFKYYLLIALFMVAPILLFVYNLVIAPFTRSAIKKKKEYFCGLDLSE